MMRRLFVLLFRLAVTLAMVAVAGVVGLALWDYYLDAPWTRDGRVRADVVAVAPDVSGLVTEVLVSDNQTFAAATCCSASTPSASRWRCARPRPWWPASRRRRCRARSDYERYKQLSDAAVSQQRSSGAATEQEAKAAYDQAVADRDLAKLNLERSVVRARSTADHQHRAAARRLCHRGRGVMALIDERHASGRGLFRGDQAAAHSCGRQGDGPAARRDGPVAGRVQSIAGGIEDRERSAGSNLLANVNPTFAWVRLAQRIPVRIVLDPLPEGVQLISGRTATVEIDAPPQERPQSLLDRLRQWLSRNRSLTADRGGR